MRLGKEIQALLRSRLTTRCGLKAAYVPTAASNEEVGAKSGSFAWRRPQDPGRHTRDDALRWNVFRHYGPRSDDGPLADRDSAENGS
jgi:hypothetical protein